MEGSYDSVQTTGIAGEAMMTITSVESLLNDLLTLTLSLEETVFDQECEPEQWIELLDKRQQVIDQLSGMFAQGISLTEAQKHTYLKPAYEADQKIIPRMDRMKQASETQLANLRKSKAANEQYGGYQNSHSPYGAFFDKKK
jgi:flagellar protein FliT